MVILLIIPVTPGPGYGAPLDNEEKNLFDWH